MQPLQHQMMGYDRAITTFSPDGRLLQVEYADKTVKNGTSAIGIKCKNGVVIVADKRVTDKLKIDSSVDKIYEIDHHLMTATAGISSDGRILAQRMQTKAQQNILTFGSEIDVLNVVKDIADLKQMTTQSGGIRPFGVSIIYGGIDTTGPRLFVTEPSGVYFEYKACVVGEGEQVIKELLAKEYKENMTHEEGLKLAIKGLKLFLDKNFTPDRVEAAVINMDNGSKFHRLSKTDIKKYI